MNAAEALALLDKIATYAQAVPSIVMAVQNFWPKIGTLISVAKGNTPDQAAMDNIASLEADIDGHIAHIAVEAAKLGQ